VIETAMNRDLEHKTAIVTGGASGIGLATARTLAREGATVVVFDRNPQETGFRTCAVDVTDRAGIDRAAAEVVSEHGGIDILVNNAGIGTPVTVEAMSAEEWRRVLAVNLDGMFHCTQALLPAMKARGGGAIVNVSSMAGKRVSFHGGANYTASKAGVLGFTRHCAFELAIYGIRVNAVCPGPVLTPMVEKLNSPEQTAAIAKLVPLGRWVTPEDVAEVILFLASPAAAMCTGTTIDVDGGMMVSNGQPYAEYFERRGVSAPPASRP
jgi:NAD(P)-dependent dehydrogenase (short-subunit alcohol dehydrogenase family)